ncbi:MAG TPA: BadF/BadG/BcrA/BcrD ATPase family protein [Terriglobia bacterium]|nr:BadF/BadG/BcrA/BcrD ATPase family protein [Terriglobia bacterium]
MGYLFGIDGGGTRTTAWLADGRERVLARVEVGASNPVKVGFPAAQKELLRAYRRACSQARIRPAILDAICAGLAGSDSARVHARLLDWLRKSIPAGAYALTTDADIALSAGVGEGAGIIVIAGTGSIAYGRNQRGKTLRCGGWGNLFDDAGSGYDLGRKAVGCALRALDGRGRATCLTRALCRELGVGRVSEVVALPLSPQEIAALFAVVLRAATDGDRVARRILNEAACDLAVLAGTLITGFRWKGRASRVLCAGGVFQSCSMIRRKFARHVRTLAPKARVSLLRRQPVEGALFIAQRLAESRQVASSAEP